MNHIAPEGQIWVCAACGKRSRDRYGEQRIDSGWDESCMLNSVLCHDQQSPAILIPGQEKPPRWIAVDPQPE